ncbi:MAG: hypothetical protein U0K19_04905 [Bifidobacteriaceae bacterium]|nr:hypothetical protein [Bifidobacteriaceae bacterium]
MTPHIRIHNDFTVQWSIFQKTEGDRKEYNLEGKELVLRLQNPYRTENLTDFTVRANVIEWTYLGKDQKSLGPYTLILVENQGKEGMVTIDKVNAFTLVAHTEDETGNDEDAVKIQTLRLESEAVIKGGVGSIDTELNRDSENAIANKAVTLAFDDVAQSLTKLNDALSDKQDAIEDLDAIRSGAAAGATALQSVPDEYVKDTDLKTINGEPITGEGDLIIKPGVSEDDIISNEKVTAAALNDLDTRIKKLPTNDTVANKIAEALAAERAQQEANMAALQEQIAALSAELVIMRAESASNEKVTAAALNDLNNRLNS